MRCYHPVLRALARSAFRAKTPSSALWKLHHETPTLRIQWSRSISTSPPSLFSTEKNPSTRSSQTNTISDTDNSNKESGKSLPGVVSPGEKLAVVYTCKVCDTRSAKVISKQAYEDGVVLIRCPCCENLHLFADRLGWFEDGSWDVEKVLKDQGDRAKVFTQDNVLELTEQDVIGEKK